MLSIMLSNFDFQQFFSATIVLFAIIDIIGMLPIIINLRKKGRKISATKAALISMIVFISFLYIGEGFLRLFGVDISSFAVAGSVILFILAMEMILDIQIFRDNPDIPKDVTITPVVFPLIVGAGSLTALLSLRAEFHIVNIICAILANTVIVYIAIKVAKNFEKFLAPSVLYVSQKLFGIILLSISVKLFISNLTPLIKTF